MDTIEGIVQQFSVVFSSPSYENGIYLMLAWIKTQSRARISNFLRVRRYMPGWVPKNGKEWKHFSVFYRFFHGPSGVWTNLANRYVVSLSGHFRPAPT